MDIASIKAQCNSLWNQTFDFYKETIIIFKTPTEVNVSSNPSSFNFFYGNNSPGFDVSYVTQSGTFFGTFEEIDQEDNNQRKYYPTDNPAITSDAKARLTLEISALDFFKDLEKIVVDGRPYQRLSDFQFRGPFERTQFNIWLKPFSPK